MQLNKQHESNEKELRELLHRSRQQIDERDKEIASLKVCTCARVCVWRVHACVRPASICVRVTGSGVHAAVQQSLCACVSRQCVTSHLCSVCQRKASAHALAVSSMFAPSFVRSTRGSHALTERSCVPVLCICLCVRLAGCADG